MRRFERYTLIKDAYRAKDRYNTEHPGLRFQIRQVDEDGRRYWDLWILEEI